ncbi:ROK family transcriptional regulator [Paenibacillus mendelii]|uniref:ROK family protein n=1 Tax=Paenibacillus mendelii TaxID=206163 RepID=A0ABV6J8K7_9BACL|nr:ROK family transcriptional regulator [Paenibacillus mendelii]MCQ6562148.1 ROK family transcriptional regulator [Paenibacillus mendelii]
MKASPSEISVLQWIQNSDGVSRKTLAEKLQLSQASITIITKTLIDKAFIVEGDRIGKGLGRKEVMLYPNPDKFRFLGIDIGGYRIRLALSDNSLQLLHQVEYLMEELEERSDMMQVLLNHIHTFFAQCNITAVDAIGIGVTGIIDKEHKRVMNIPNVNNWDDLDIVDRLSAQFECPVYLDESGRVMALAEKVLGKAKDVDDFIVVHIAYGVVAGVMINDAPLRGANNVGGLLGHITVDERAGRCLCGNYGCLENIVTYPMIEKEFRKREHHANSMAANYALNNKNAIDVCIDAGKALGIALSNVVNLFNPQIVYLGGPVFDDFPIVFEETKRTILLRANRFATIGMKLEYSSFGNQQGILGALTLARASFTS